MKIGDVVWLKSGGPAMTVKLIRAGCLSESSIECVWFTDEDDTRIQLFDSRTLTLKPAMPKKVKCERKRERRKVG